MHTKLLVSKHGMTVSVYKVRKFYITTMVAVLLWVVFGVLLLPNLLNCMHIHKSFILDLLIPLNVFTEQSPLTDSLPKKSNFQTYKFPIDLDN